MIWVEGMWWLSGSCKQILPHVLKLFSSLPMLNGWAISCLLDKIALAARHSHFSTPPSFSNIDNSCPHATHFCLFSFSFIYFLIKYAPTPYLVPFHFVFKYCCKVLVFFFPCPSFWSYIYIYLMGVVTAAEYGEARSCQGLLDRRIQSLTRESLSGKWVFLSLCGDCEGGWDCNGCSINCFWNIPILVTSLYCSSSSPSLMLLMVILARRLNLLA